KPNSELEITNVMTNPTRAHFINVLKRMGANIKITRTYSKCGEDVCDMTVRSSQLKGTIITKEEVPSLIDEFLILSVAAAYARGTSKFCGLSELRVKESNRFDAIINMLSSSGVSCRSVGDDIVIDGKGEVTGGSEIKTNLDHRTAMASFILGLNAHHKIRIDDISPISTSFPGFTQLYTQIGGIYKSE
ncbi:MAG: 3-phosphoshikimate 1-carboxyvinyltransferase, partial [Hyphomicrobiales bacterium]